MRLLIIVLHDLRATVLRSLLTCLSMLIGVLAIVGVSAAGAVTEELFVAQSEQTTGRAATYAFDFPLTAGTATAVGFQEELQRRIGPQDVGVAIVVEQLKVADVAGIRLPLPLTWVEGDLAKVRRLPVVAGSIPTSRQPYPPWVAVNRPAADELGLRPGDTIRLSPDDSSPLVAFTVAAVIADGSTGERAAYAPLAQARWWHSDLVGESARALITVPAAAEPELRQLLAAAVARTGVEASPVQRIDEAPALRRTLALVQAIFLGCGALTLGVSALGILNIGLASLNERSRELVVRRAIGARRRDIVAQILCAAIGIGVVASAVAITVATVVLQTVVPGMVPAGSPVETPAFPWAACAWGVLAALVTAVAGALVPAIKASRLPVAQALRT